ncbi:MAG: hypothetical protein LBQ93_08170 [Treponema sp.]|nr:hypothetical protein [Treponema sp.]
MKNKIITLVIFVLLTFAGIIAMTQETEVVLTGLVNETPGWVKPLRWFRSNKGGMVLEEALTQRSALHNEYALSVNFTRKEELPVHLLPFYNDEYFIETRILYENEEPVRKQWIFRNTSGTVRLNAAFLESPKIKKEEQAEKQISGFIEIFNADSFLISEYRFFENGKRSRTDYNYKDGLLISSTVLLWENGAYREDYADFLRYNRSLYLRSVERVFYTGRQVSLANEPLKVSFSRYLSDTSQVEGKIGEKITSYPEFFGDFFIEKDNKIVYITDERNRVISQTLYDAEGKIVWVVRNTWKNDRIVSTVKIEGGKESLAEFEYNSAGERIVERNYKNGILERLVRTEGKKEIEELYLNNVVVLRAVWEDGRKISETRTGNR